MDGPTYVEAAVSATPWYQTRLCATLLQGGVVLIGGWSLHRLSVRRERAERIEDAVGDLLSAEAQQVESEDELSVREIATHSANMKVELIAPELRGRAHLLMCLSQLSWRARVRAERDCISPPQEPTLPRVSYLPKFFLTLMTEPGTSRLDHPLVDFVLEHWGTHIDAMEHARSELVREARELTHKVRAPLLTPRFIARCWWLVRSTPRRRAVLRRKRRLRAHANAARDQGRPDSPRVAVDIPE